MRAVAKRCLGACFAAAKPNCAVFFGGVFHRGKSGALVTAIAEGLFGRAPARAPEIGFSGFDFDRIGGLLGNDRCVRHHVVLVVCWI